MGLLYTEILLDIKFGAQVTETNTGEMIKLCKNKRKFVREETENCQHQQSYWEADENYDTGHVWEISGW